jgi:hypothetical protein
MMEPRATQGRPRPMRSEFCVSISMIFIHYLKGSTHGAGGGVLAAGDVLLALLVD